MALNINSNISSLTAQRNLYQSQNALSTSMQRLSSGLRINSAKDDAAGLAISDRMTAQVRGLNQAVRNANDGISLAQTAEGALQETTNILQRIRELAVQSVNDTNTSADRVSLQAEVTQLQAELNRIATSTEFNGQRLLDGSFSSRTFQVGANAGQTINFSVASAKGSSIGGIANGTGTEVTSATATDITIAIGSGAATAITTSANFTNGTYKDASSAYAKAAAINDAGIAGLSATASTSGSATFGAVGGTAGDTYNLTINGVAIYSNADVSTAITITDVRDAINAESNQTGVIASVNGTTMTLTASDGRNIVVDESGGTGFAAGDGLSNAAGDFAGSEAAAVTQRGAITLSATDTITIGGTQTVIGFTAAGVAKDTLGVDNIDISSQSGGETAIKRIDAALASISSSRANLGAIQNRFNSTISNLQNVSENISAARGRIQDADFAKETTALSRNQILEQAGLAMLAQANQSQQGVLSLLR